MERQATVIVRGPYLQLKIVLRAKLRWKSCIKKLKNRTLLSSDQFRIWLISMVEFSFFDKILTFFDQKDVSYDQKIDSNSLN